MESTQADFISVLNSILLLVDYKSEMFSQIRSGDRKAIKDAVVASSKAAALLNVPVVMTSCGQNLNDEFIQEIKDIFPKQEIIIRNCPSANALSDEYVSRTIKNHKRDKLVISGLWTSESLAETAIAAMQEGYDVYGLIDACGDTSHERHNYGVQKMLKAGLTPITWMSLASEWMNRWADPSDEYDDIAGKYSVMLSHLAKQ